MATQNDKVVTTREGLPHINSNNPLQVCSREITRENENIKYVQHHSSYGHKIYRGGGILQGAPTQWGGLVR